VALLLVGGVARAEAPAIDVSPVTLEVSPEALEFAGPGTRTVAVRNRGAAPLTLDRVTLAPDSSGFVLDEIAPRTLQPGEELALHVQFVPDSRRQQAFGAVQIQAGDSVRGVALRTGASWLLTLLVFFPLVGAALILFVPAGRNGLTRAIALATSLVPLAASVVLFMRFDRGFMQASGNGGLQFIQHAVWIPSFNVEYYVGVDGLSVTMVLLTALISTIAVIASFNIDKQVRGYFALLLLLETGMLGTFCALDFFLFYIFWELMLLPMYFLIGIWGGPRKEYAAI